MPRVRGVETRLLQQSTISAKTGQIAAWLSEQRFHWTRPSRRELENLGIAGAINRLVRIFNTEALE
jgi:hypothetical protein